MSLVVSCGECNAQFKASPAHEGKKAKCPKCAAVIVITAAPVVEAAPTSPTPESGYSLQDPAPAPAAKQKPVPAAAAASEGAYSIQAPATAPLKPTAAAQSRPGLWKSAEIECAAIDDLLARHMVEHRRWWRAKASILWAATKPPHVQKFLAAAKAPKAPTWTETFMAICRRPYGLIIGVVAAVAIILWLPSANETDMDALRYIVLPIMLTVFGFVFSAVPKMRAQRAMLTGITGYEGRTEYLGKSGGARHYREFSAKLSPTDRVERIREYSRLRALFQTGVIWSLALGLAAFLTGLARFVALP